MGLRVAFVRNRERRDRLPHDLCHLVMEEALGIVHGFTLLYTGHTGHTGHTH